MWCSVVVVVVVVVIVYLSIDRSIYRSIYLSICLSASLKTPLFCDTSSVFLNLTISKTQQFYETSLFFEHDNVKNETILRDLLIFRTWQHQKRSNSARLLSKMESWVQSLRPRTNGFCDVSTPPIKVLRLPGKSDARSYEVLHLSRKIILANLTIWCSKMQTLSGNQRPHLLT